MAKMKLAFAIRAVSSLDVASASTVTYPYPSQ
jgi:hypothetical protein